MAPVEPIVDLAPGTERNQLAQAFARRIRESLFDSQEKRRSFKRLRGSLYVVANDPLPLPGDAQRVRSARLLGVGEALTLRFDFGRLTIHDGLVGVPDVTIRGDQDILDALSKLSLGSEAMASGRAALTAYRRGALKVYGFWMHSRFLTSVLRILGQPAAPGSDSRAEPL